MSYSATMAVDWLPAAAPAARRPAVWMFVLVLLAAIAVYANSLRNQFALDDVAIVQCNAHVNSLDWIEIWSDNYWPQQDGVPPDILYRPLTVWSYLATFALVPSQSAWPYHLGNLLLHALVSAMALVLAWRIFANRMVAFLAALLFALHPLHAEVVANIVGRAELLSSAFSLAALLVFLPPGPLLAQQGEGGPAQRSYWHGILVAACFFFAMLAKETPAPLLAGFFFIDLWRWSHWDAGRRPSLVRWIGRQSVRYYLPLAVVFIIYLGLRLNACGVLRDFRAVHPLVNPLVQATIAQRIVTPFALLAKYLQLTLWPAVLSADYSSPSLMPLANPFAPMALAGLLLTLLSILITGAYWRKAPQIILVFILFAFTYALVANFIRIGTIFGERLFYLPSLFIFMCVAWLAVAGYRRLPASRHRAAYRALAIACLIIACLAMSVRTFVRNTDWHDNVTLAIATARDNPNSAKACHWAGMVLVTHGPDQAACDFGEQILLRSVGLYAHYGDSYWELAKYYGRQQHLAKSLLYLAHAAQYGPGKADIRMALSEVKKDLKAHDPGTYIPELKAYQREHPTDAAAYLALALASDAQGQLDLAEQQCVEALKIAGQFHEAAGELALIRLRTGKVQLAIDVLIQYAIHVRSCADARFTLVSALLELDPATHPQALTEAQRFLDEAAALSKEDPRVRQLRAQLAQRQLGSQRTLSAALEPGGQP